MHLRGPSPSLKEKALSSPRVTRKSAPTSSGLNPSASDITQFAKIEPLNGKAHGAVQMTVVGSWQFLGPQYVARFNTYNDALAAAKRIYIAKHHLSAIEAIGSATKK